MNEKSEAKQSDQEVLGGAGRRLSDTIAPPGKIGRALLGGAGRRLSDTIELCSMTWKGERLLMERLMLEAIAIKENLEDG